MRRSTRQRTPVKVEPVVESEQSDDHSNKRSNKRSNKKSNKQSPKQSAKQTSESEPSEAEYVTPTPKRTRKRTATATKSSDKQPTKRSARSSKAVVEDDESVRPVEQIVDSDEDMLIKKKRMMMHQSNNQSNDPDHDSDDDLLVKLEEQVDEPSTKRRARKRGRKSATEQPSDELEYRSDDQSDQSTNQPSTTPRRRGKALPKGSSKKRKNSSMKYDKNHSLNMTYSDPDDVDDNENLLDCYKPSLNSSVPIIEYMNRHIKAFQKYPYDDLAINQTVLCQNLSTTGGTLSGILNRKYPFKARGMIIRMREWLSSRDYLVVSILYKTIRHNWQLLNKQSTDQSNNQSNNQSNDQSNNQSNDQSNDSDNPAPPEQPDWNHPCMQPSNLSLVAQSINQSINQSIYPTTNVSLDQLVDFMKYDLSIEERGPLEDVISEWIGVQSFNQPVAQLAPPTRRAYKTKKSVSETINDSVDLPLKRRTRNQGKRPVKREKSDSDESSDSSAYNESSKSESSDEQSDHSVERSPKVVQSQKGRRRSRLQLAANRMYPLKRNEQLVTNQSRLHLSSNSPFTDPSWNIHSNNLSISQLNPSIYQHPDYDVINFQAPDGSVCRCPAFQSIDQSINQSNNQMPPGDYCFNVGGTVTALEWTPLSNKETIDQSIDQRQLLTVAADHKNKYHNKYRTLDQSINQAGLIQIWSFPPIKQVYDQIYPFSLSARRIKNRSVDHSDDESMLDESSNQSHDQSNNQSSDQSSNQSNNPPFLALAITHDHGDVRSMTWLDWNDWQAPSDDNDQSDNQSNNQPEPSSRRTNKRSSNQSSNHSNNQSNNQSANQVIPRIGVLAVTFGDGTALTVAVPQPQSINQLIRFNNQSISIPSIELHQLPHAFFSIPPLFNKAIHPAINNRTIPSCLSYSNASHNIAIGMTDSSVFTYSLSNQLSNQSINQSSNQSNNQSINQMEDQSIIHPLSDYWVRPGDYGIRSITWNPINPSIFAVSTQDGFLLIFDTRGINQLPLLNISIGPEPVVQTRWLGSSATQSNEQSPNRCDCLLVAFNHSIRLIFLLKQSERFIHFHGMFACQLAEGAVINQFDIQSSNQPGNDPTIFLTFASSDGQVNCIANSLLILDKDRTSHLVRTSGASVVRSINQSNDQSNNQSTIQPKFSVSSHYQVADCRVRDSRLVREQRVKSQLADQTNNPTTSLPFDDVVAQRCVSLQKNFDFPRVLASGGLAGIVRVQTITNM